MGNYLTVKINFSAVDGLKFKVQSCSEFRVRSSGIGIKFGFTDRAGKIVITPKFDNAFGFQRETLGWTR
jgi:hypothetical protein